MLEELIDDPITLRLATGEYSDGEALYTEVSALAYVTEMMETDIDRWGRVKNTSVFLIIVDDVESIPLESQVIYNEVIYDVQAVKVCRDTDDNIECFRVLVV